MTDDANRRREDLIRKRALFVAGINRDTTLQAAVRQVGIELAQYVNCDPDHRNFGKAWPSVGRLAEALGLHDRSVRRCLDKLRKHRWITGQPTEGGRAQTSVISFNWSRAAQKGITHADKNPDPQDRVSSENPVPQVRKPCPTGPKTLTHRTGDLYEEHHDDLPESISSTSAGPDDLKSRWNEMAGRVGLPQVREMTDRRRRAAKTLLRKIGDVTAFDEALGKIAASDFLSGRAGKWRASLDWILKHDNLVKVIEGQYDDRQAGGRSTSMSAALDRLEQDLTGG